MSQFICRLENSAYPPNSIGNFPRAVDIGGRGPGSSLPGPRGLAAVIARGLSPCRRSGALAPSSPSTGLLHDRPGGAVSGLLKLRRRRRPLLAPSEVNPDLLLATSPSEKRPNPGSLLPVQTSVLGLPGREEMPGPASECALSSCRLTRVRRIPRRLRGPRTARGRVSPPPGSC